MQIQLLHHAPDIAHDLGAEQRTGQPAAVAEKGDSRARDVVAAHIAQQADQPAVQAGAVHVAAHGRHLDAGLDALLEALLAQRHKRLLDRLVRQGGLVAQGLYFGGNGVEGGVQGRVQVVVVEHAGVGFGDEFARGRVEEEVVESVERGGALGRVVDAVGVGFVQGVFARVVRLVTGVDGFGVASDGELAVDDWVLGGQVGFVKVVRVLHVAASLASLKCNRCVGSDEHGHTAGAASGAGVALFVESNVSRADNGVTAIPGG